MSWFFILHLVDVEIYSDEEEKDAKTRRVVRSNNFTQQTNTFDVDKHMCVLRHSFCERLDY